MIVTEGLEDKEFIADNTENWEAVRETVLRYSPEEAEKVTGVPAELIREVARAYATTKKAGVYYTLGITEHTCGTDNVYALSNLVMMTGHLGKRSAGMNPLRGQNNVQGANDSGATPVFYPGYQKADDPDVRAKFADAWGVAQSETEGLNLNVMMKAMADGRIRGLYLMGEDIVISEPNVCRVEEAMNELDFVVVQDIFFNESCRYARRGAARGLLCREGRRVHQFGSACPESAQGRGAAGPGPSRLADPPGGDETSRLRAARLLGSRRDLRRDGLAVAQVRRHLVRAHRNERVACSGR